MSDEALFAFQKASVDFAIAIQSYAAASDDAEDARKSYRKAKKTFEAAEKKYRAAARKNSNGTKPPGTEFRDLIKRYSQAVSRKRNRFG